MNPAPFKKSMTEKFGSTVMDETTKISQTQQIDSLGILPSTPRQMLAHKKGAVSDVQVHRSH